MASKSVYMSLRGSTPPNGLTHGWDGGEAHSVTEMQGDQVIALRFNCAIPFEGFSNWSEKQTQLFLRGQKFSSILHPHLQEHNFSEHHCHRNDEEENVTWMKTLILSFILQIYIKCLQCARCWNTALNRQPWLMPLWSFFQLSVVLLP